MLSVRDVVVVEGMVFVAVSSPYLVRLVLSEAEVKVTFMPYGQEFE